MQQVYVVYVCCVRLVIGKLPNAESDWNTWAGEVLQTAHNTETMLTNVQQHLENTAVCMSQHWFGVRGLLNK